MKLTSTLIFRAKALTQIQSGTKSALAKLYSEISSKESNSKSLKVRELRNCLSHHSSVIGMDNEYVELAGWYLVSESEEFWEPMRELISNRDESMREFINRSRIARLREYTESKIAEFEKNNIQFYKIIIEVFNFLELAYNESLKKNTSL